MLIIDKIIKWTWWEQRTYSKWTEPLPGTIKGETRLGRNQNRDMKRVVAGSEKDVSRTRWVYSPETGSSRGDITGMRESIFLSLLWDLKIWSSHNCLFEL